MGSIEFGAKQAVVNCVKVQKNEKVVIITDLARKHIAEAIKIEAEKITPENVKLFVMEDFGDRDESGKNPLKFPVEIKTAMKDADVSFYVATGKRNELKSFRCPMTDAVEKYGLRHAHMIGINDEIMKTGMSVDYAAVQELSKKVYDIAHKAKKIRVTNPAGTDFTAELNPEKIRWLISDGNITVEHWSNLPDGEIFTCVDNIKEGVIVCDGILGDHFSEKYGPITKTPVTWHIKDSRVIKIECDNKELKNELIEYSKIDENANRIGELAIGTNIGLKKLIGNLLQDEKFPGVHVAMGHGYPEKTGSDWSSDAHLDAVLLNVTVEVDGKIIMKNGEFII